MPVELLNTSIVVLAQEHNPTILHPAFLAAQGIVPEEWEIADSPICTPAFSIVKYANGITFNVESNRFVVTEEKPNGDPDQPQIPRLAADYVGKLPHVRYRSVGVNFTGYYLRQEPEQFLVDRFLKPGPWNSSDRPMKAMGARFVYRVDQSVLRMGLDGGQVQQGGESQDAVLLSGNFHADLSEENSLEELTTLIQRWPDRRIAFLDFAKSILGLRD